MKNLCLSSELGDCTISTGLRSFVGHRMVLSFCSPYFRSLFDSLPNYQQQHPVIFIRGVNEDLLGLLLQFIYGVSVSVPVHQLDPLIKLARDLQVECLKDVVVQV